MIKRTAPISFVLPFWPWRSPRLWQQERYGHYFHWDRDKLRSARLNSFCASLIMFLCHQNSPQFYFSKSKEEAKKQGWAACEQVCCVMQRRYFQSSEQALSFHGLIFYVYHEWVQNSQRPVVQTEVQRNWCTRIVKLPLVAEAEEPPSWDHASTYNLRQ